MFGIPKTPVGHYEILQMSREVFTCEENKTKKKNPPKPHIFFRCLPLLSRLIRTKDHLLFFLLSCSCRNFKKPGGLINLICVLCNTPHVSVTNTCGLFREPCCFNILSKFFQRLYSLTWEPLQRLSVELLLN